MITTTCPACGFVAEVLWRTVLEGTDGPVEHEKIQCVHGHWFLLPVASLAGSLAARSRAPESRAAAPPERAARVDGQS